MAGKQIYTSSLFVQSGSVAKFESGISSSQLTVNGTIVANQYLDSDGNVITTGGGGGTPSVFFAGTPTGVSASSPFSQDHVVTIEGDDKQGHPTDLDGDDIIKNGVIKIQTTSSLSFTPNFYNFMKIGNNDEELITVQQGPASSYILDDPSTQLKEMSAGTHRYIIYAADTSQGGATHQVYHTVTLKSFVNTAPTLVIPTGSIENSPVTMSLDHDSDLKDLVLHFSNSFDENQKEGQQDFLRRLQITRDTLNPDPLTGPGDTTAGYLLNLKHPGSSPSFTELDIINSKHNPSNLHFTASLTEYETIKDNENSITISEPQEEKFSLRLEDRYPNAKPPGEQGIVTGSVTMSIVPPPTSSISDINVYFSGTDNASGDNEILNNSHTHTILYDRTQSLDSAEIANLNKRYTSSIVKVKVSASITEPPGFDVVPEAHTTRVIIQSSSNSTIDFSDNKNVLGAFLFSGSDTNKTITASHHSNTLGGTYTPLDENHFYVLTESIDVNTKSPRTIHYGAHNELKETLNRTDYLQHGNHNHHKAFTSDHTANLTLNPCPTIKIDNVVVEVESGSFGSNVGHPNLTSSLLYNFTSSVFSSQTQSLFGSFDDEKFKQYVSQSIVRLRIKCDITEPFGPDHNEITASFSVGGASSPYTSNFESIKIPFNTESAHNFTYTTDHDYSEFSGKELLVSSYTSSWYEFIQEPGVNQFSAVFSSQSNAGTNLNTSTSQSAEVSMSVVPSIKINDLVYETETYGYSGEAATDTSVRTVLYGDAHFTNDGTGSSESGYSWRNHETASAYASHSVSRFRVRGTITEPVGPSAGESSISVDLKANYGISVTNDIETINVPIDGTTNNPTLNDYANFISSSVSEFDEEGKLVTTFTSSWIGKSITLPSWRRGKGESLTYTITGSVNYIPDPTYEGSNNGIEISPPTTNTIQVKQTPATIIESVEVVSETHGYSGEETKNTTRTVLYGDNRVTNSTSASKVWENHQLSVAYASQSVSRFKLKVSVQEPLGPFHYGSATYAIRKQKDGNITSGVDLPSFNTESADYYEWRDDKLFATYTSSFKGITLDADENITVDYMALPYILHNPSNEIPINKHYNNTGQYTDVSVIDTPPAEIRDIVVESETEGYSGESKTDSRTFTVLYGDTHVTNNGTGSGETGASWATHPLAEKFVSSSVSRFRYRFKVVEPVGYLHHSSSVTKIFTDSSNTETSDTTPQLFDTTSAKVIDEGYFEPNGPSADLNKLIYTVTSSFYGKSLESNEIDGEDYGYEISIDHTAPNENSSTSTSYTPYTFTIKDTPKTLIEDVFYEVETEGYSGTATTNNVTRTILYGDSTTNDGTGSGETGESWGRDSNGDLTHPLGDIFASHSVLRTRVRAKITEPLGYHHNETRFNFYQGTGNTLRFDKNSTDGVTTDSNLDSSNRRVTTYTSSFKGLTLTSNNKSGQSYSFTGKVEHSPSGENESSFVVNTSNGGTQISVKDTPNIEIHVTDVDVETLGESGIEAPNYTFTTNIPNTHTRTTLLPEQTTRSTGSGLIAPFTGAAVLRTNIKTKITEPLGPYHQPISIGTIYKGSDNVLELGPQISFATNSNDLLHLSHGYDLEYRYTSSYTSSFTGSEVSNSKQYHQLTVGGNNINLSTNDDYELTDSGYQNFIKINPGSDHGISNFVIEVETLSGSNTGTQTSRTTHVLHGNTGSETNHSININYPDPDDREQLVSFRVLASILQPPSSEHFTTKVTVSQSKSTSNQFFVPKTTSPATLNLNTGSNNNDVYSSNSEPSTIEGTLIHYTSSWTPVHFKALGNTGGEPITFEIGTILGYTEPGDNNLFLDTGINVDFEDPEDTGYNGLLVNSPLEPGTYPYVLVEKTTSNDKFTHTYGQPSSTAYETPYTYLSEILIDVPGYENYTGTAILERIQLQGKFDYTNPKFSSLTIGGQTIIDELVNKKFIGTGTNKQITIWPFELATGLLAKFPIQPFDYTQIKIVDGKVAASLNYAAGYPIHGIYNNGISIKLKLNVKDTSQTSPNLSFYTSPNVIFQAQENLQPSPTVTLTKKFSINPSNVNGGVEYILGGNVNSQNINIGTSFPDVPVDNPTSFSFASSDKDRNSAKIFTLSNHFSVPGNNYSNVKIFVERIEIRGSFGNYKAQDDNPNVTTALTNFELGGVSFGDNIQLEYAPTPTSGDDEPPLGRNFFWDTRPLNLNTGPAFLRGNLISANDVANHAVFEAMSEEQTGTFGSVNNRTFGSTSGNVPYGRREGSRKTEGYTGDWPTFITVWSSSANSDEPREINLNNNGTVSLNFFVGKGVNYPVGPTTSYPGNGTSYSDSQITPTNFAIKIYYKATNSTFENEYIDLSTHIEDTFSDDIYGDISFSDIENLELSLIGIKLKGYLNNDYRYIDGFHIGSSGTSPGTKYFDNIQLDTVNRYLYFDINHPDNVNRDLASYIDFPSVATSQESNQRLSDLTNTFGVNRPSYPSDTYDDFIPVFTSSLNPINLDGNGKIWIRYNTINLNANNYEIELDLEVKGEISSENTNINFIFDNNLNSPLTFNSIPVLELGGEIGLPSNLSPSPLYFNDFKHNFQVRVDLGEDLPTQTVPVSFEIYSDSDLSDTVTNFDSTSPTFTISPSDDGFDILGDIHTNYGARFNQDSHRNNEKLNLKHLLDSYLNITDLDFNYSNLELYVEKIEIRGDFGDYVDNQGRREEVHDFVLGGKSFGDNVQLLNDSSKPWYGTLTSTYTLEESDEKNLTDYNNVKAALLIADYQPLENNEESSVFGDHTKNRSFGDSDFGRKNGGDPAAFTTAWSGSVEGNRRVDLNSDGTIFISFKPQPGINYNVYVPIQADDYTENSYEFRITFKVINPDTPEDEIIKTISPNLRIFSRIEYSGGETSNTDDDFDSLVYTRNDELYEEETERSSSIELLSGGVYKNVFDLFPNDKPKLGVNNTSNVIKKRYYFICSPVFDGRITLHDIKIKYHTTNISTTSANITPENSEKSTHLVSASLDKIYSLGDSDFEFVPSQLQMTDNSVLVHVTGALSSSTSIEFGTGSLFSSSLLDPNNSKESLYFIYPKNPSHGDYHEVKVFAKNLTTTPPTFTSESNIRFPDHLKIYSTSSNEIFSFTSDGNNIQTSSLPNGTASIYVYDPSNYGNKVTSSLIDIRVANQLTGSGYGIVTQSIFVIPPSPQTVSGDFIINEIGAHPAGMKDKFYFGLLTSESLVNYSSSVGPINPTSIVSSSRILITQGTSNYSMSLFTHTNNNPEYSTNDNNEAFYFGDSGSLELKINNTTEAQIDLQSNFDPNHKNTSQPLTNYGDANGTASFTAGGSTGRLILAKVAPFNNVSQSISKDGYPLNNGFQAWGASIELDEKIRDGYNYLELIHNIADGFTQSMNVFDWYYDDGDVTPNINGITFQYNELPGTPATHSLSGVSYFKTNTSFTASIGNILNLTSKNYPHKPNEYQPILTTEFNSLDKFDITTDGTPLSSTTSTNIVQHKVNPNTPSSRNGLRFHEGDNNFIPTADSTASVKYEINANELPNNIDPIKGFVYDGITLAPAKRAFNSPSPNAFHYSDSTTFGIGRFMKSGSNLGNLSTVNYEVPNDLDMTASFFDEDRRWSSASVEDSQSRNPGAIGGTHDDYTFWLSSSRANYDSVQNITSTNDLQQLYTGELIFPSESYSETDLPNEVDYSGIDKNKQRYYYTAIKADTSLSPQNFTLIVSGNISKTDFPLGTEDSILGTNALDGNINIFARPPGPIDEGNVGNGGSTPGTGFGSLTGNTTSNKNIKKDNHNQFRPRFNDRLTEEDLGLIAIDFTLGQATIDHSNDIFLIRIAMSGSIDPAKFIKQITIQSLFI
jgi:hypothetical protein